MNNLPDNVTEQMIDDYYGDEVDYDTEQDDYENYMEDRYEV
jgi:hypothetical protein